MTLIVKVQIPALDRLVDFLEGQQAVEFQAKIDSLEAQIHTDNEELDVTIHPKEN